MPGGHRGAGVGFWIPVAWVRRLGAGLARVGAGGGSLVRGAAVLEGHGKN